MSDVIFFYAANGRRDGIALCSAQYGQNQLCGRLLGAWVHPATGIVAFLQSNNKASRSGRLLDIPFGRGVKTSPKQSARGNLKVQSTSKTTTSALNDDVSLAGRTTVPFRTEVCPRRCSAHSVSRHAGTTPLET